MINLSTNEKDFHHNEQLAEFESMAMPYQDRLYRTALLLTKNPRKAGQLIQVTTLQAKKTYHQLEPGTNFGAWLSQLLVKNFIRKYGKFRTQ